MNILNRAHISTLPAAIVYQPACVNALPMSAETSDVWSNSGSGIGSGSEAVRSAIGEYFERRHFYMEVTPDLIGPLGLSLTPTEQGSFINALQQTCDGSKPATEIHNHQFNLSEVFRASDATQCFVPTACISLSAYKTANDSSIYPLRDTCGCSFHWDPKTALFGSLKEQLERQFLAKFWLTRICKRIVPEQMVTTELGTTQLTHLYKLLKTGGNVTVIDISDSLFPGVCILTVYGSPDTRHVNYCAGMAYAEDLQTALSKSIRELWQTFRFIDLFCATDGDTSEIEDPYLSHFLNCNSFETYADITRVTSAPSYTAESTRKLDADALLATLNTLGIAGFIYMRQLTINNKDYFACKYFSPDLFMHMNNSSNINLQNNYSRSFFDNICEIRKSVMVPFP